MNLVAPAADSLSPIDSMDLDWAETGVRKANRRDVLLVHIAEGPTVADMFTQNRFYVAPVQVCHEHLANGRGVRAIVVNTDNADVGTSAPGLAHTHQTCDAVARLLGVSPEQVLPLSTGVILKPLPVDRTIAGLLAVGANTKSDSWLAAAEATMTTDTVPKAASAMCTLSDKAVRMSGISKGAGMIRPSMTAMPGLIAAGADVDDAALQELVRYAADHPFNSVTVDGSTSTNDSFVVIATGRAGTSCIDSKSHPDYAALRDALTGLAQELVQKIMCDDEGATKFITIQVEGGRNVEECRLIAYAIAHSPLVKTAFYASDPSLGRILVTIGYAGVTDLGVNGVNLWLGDVQAARNGGRNLDYHEEGGQRVMKQVKITVRIAPGRGNASAAMWTYDFSYDHVSINTDYRS